MQVTYLGVVHDSLIHVGMQRIHVRTRTYGKNQKTRLPPLLSHSACSSLNSNFDCENAVDS